MSQYSSASCQPAPATDRVTPCGQALSAFLPMVSRGLKPQAARGVKLADAAFVQELDRRPDGRVAAAAAI